MSVSPTHPASREAIGAENRAKIKINYELSIINHKEFHGSVEEHKSATSDERIIKGDG